MAVPGSSLAAVRNQAQGSMNGSGPVSVAVGKPGRPGPEQVFLRSPDTSVQVVLPAPAEPTGTSPQVPGTSGPNPGSGTAPDISTLLADRTALSRHVSRQLRLPADGDIRTQVTLRPDGLGTVEVELTTDPSGRLSLVLRVENPAVLQALRADRDALLMNLEASGLDLGEAQLGFAGFGPGEDRNPRERHPGTRPSAWATDMESPGHATLPKGRMSLAGNGRLDLFT